MQVNIDGHHVEVTEPLREYVLSKLGRLERHCGAITSAHVTLVLEKNRQKAEAKIHVAGGDLFAEAEQDDMYAAIDVMVDKLDRQLIRHKEKHSNHK